MDSKIGFEINLIVVEAIRGRSVCEFHGSNGNGFGDIWWTDNPIYFSSIDSVCRRRLTWSPKRVDSTNQKRLPTNAHAHRDVFQARLLWEEMVKLKLNTNYS